MWPFRNKETEVPADDEAFADEYGHYRVLHREDGQPWLLGHGAMGLTYKAEDINLRSPVALKVISPLIAEQPGARELFLSEARGAASLRHRNAAAVHHLGTNRRGELFFAMEFIDGETVDVLIQRQRRLGVLLALDIAQQTACALAAASQRGLVHRDIKPANLMLSDEGDGALTVKVIDFGLCKAMRVGETATVRADVKSGDAPVDQFFGTPHYASPEQIRCDTALDHRSDFYSLGATLWKMLTGQPLFGGSQALIRQRHLTEAPPFEALPPAVSPPVRALLTSLLQKDPAARPQSSLELIDRIEGAAYDHRGAEADPRRHWKKQGCIPLVGSVLAHNYHLEALADENQDASLNPIFRAEDVAGQRAVAVQLLDRDRPLDAVRASFERLAAAPHPNLLRHHTLTSCRGQPFVVSEWVNGFSLADVLRARSGTLTAPEVHILIRQVARAMEHAEQHELNLPDVHPGAIHVHFGGLILDPTELRALRAQPVHKWPEFSLKLRLHTEEETEAFDGGSDATGCAATRALARLAADLLGIGAATVAPSRPLDLPPAVRRLLQRVAGPGVEACGPGEFAAALEMAFADGGSSTKSAAGLAGGDLSGRKCP